MQFVAVWHILNTARDKIEFPVEDIPFFPEALNILESSSILEALNRNFLSIYGKHHAICIHVQRRREEGGKDRGRTVRGTL